MVDMQAELKFGSVHEHGMELYLVACQLDLPALEAACRPSAVQTHSIANPMQHSDSIGLSRTAILVSRRGQRYRSAMVRSNSSDRVCHIASRTRPAIPQSLTPFTAVCCFQSAR